MSLAVRVSARRRHHSSGAGWLPDTRIRRSRFSVAEPGRLLLLRGSANGPQATTPLDAVPVEVVIDGPAHIEGSERPLLTLARGQFDKATELEVLVNTNAGITVVSAESGVVGEFPEPAGSFASFDINADGVSDVALIAADQVVVYRSNP